MTGGDARGSGPSWPELLDALYLAACQQEAEPYREWRPESDPAPPGAALPALPDPPPDPAAAPAATAGPRDPAPGPEPAPVPAPGTPDEEDGDGDGGADTTARTGGDRPAPGPPPQPEEFTVTVGAHDDDGDRASGATGGEEQWFAGRAHPWDGTLAGTRLRTAAAVPAGTLAAAPLPDALALGRALRPLRLRTEVRDSWELDEEATAERAAYEKLWVPVCRPVTERRLRLLLLVDSAPSMDLWRDTGRRLRGLLEQTAAFRSLTVAELDLTGDGPPTRDGDSSPGPDSLVLVLTDGVADAWRDGTAAARLCALAQNSPTAVLSLLPQELWEITLPTAVRARFDVPEQAAPNRRLRLRGPVVAQAELGDPVRPRAPQHPPVPVPLLELTPGSLGRWASMVASPGGRHDSAVLLTGSHGDLGVRRYDYPGPEPAPEEQPEHRNPAREAVRLFKGRASPTAYALAKRLAAAPLNLPVMRLIQRSLPGARDWNLGEIMLFGLLHRTDHAGDVEDTERVSFDFPEGVREELLGLGTRTETMTVLRQVEQVLGPRLAAVPDGEAVVAWHPDAPYPKVNERNRPFVRPLYSALAAVSGPYLGRATRLRQLLSTGPPPVVAAAAASPPVRRTAGRTPPAGGPLPPAPPPPPSTQTPSPYGAPGGSVSTASQPSPVPAIPPNPTPTRLWGNVPQRNRNFTGREDLLERLSQRLSSSGTPGGTSGVTAVLPEALHGMGGVGKSQIAIEYVYRSSREYQLVWWVPSEQTSLIVQSLIELGEQMGLGVGADRSAVAAVLEALRVGVPYSNWLLVFDNAEDPGEVRKFFPNDGPGRVMVTSRNSRWSTLASYLEVDVFAREESVALIRRRSPQIPDDSADRLAETLGDLPLAVEQAAVWLAETGMPVNQYLDLFETKYAELLQVAPPPDYQLPVAAAWNVSLDRLRENQPAALQLLQVCAFFAPEPIDWDLFSAVRGVAAPTALRATLDDPIQLGRAVREIGRYALARIDHRKSTIQLHRLVQRVLVQQMNSQERAEMRHCAHEILANADPRNPRRSAEWPRYSSLLPHVRTSQMADCEDPWVRELVLNEARFLLSRSDYTEALDVADNAAGIWRRGLGDDHEHVLAVDLVRVQVLRWQNRYEEAFDLQSELLERCRRSLGDRHPTTQRAVSLMAVLYRVRGDFFGARSLDRQAFEALRHEFGPDDPTTLEAAHNYAVSLRLSADRKDLEEAYRVDEDTFQRRVEVLGDDHMQTMLSLYALYIDLLEVGRYQEAAEGYEQLRERVLTMLGDEHSMTSWVIRELSVTRRKLGDHQGAFELSHQALALSRARPGQDKHNLAWAELNHATDLRQTGDLPGSYELGRHAMELCRETLGDDHPHTYATATNLAVTLRLLDRTDEARELNQGAAEGLSRLLSPLHARAILAKTNLASDFAELGDSVRARELGEELYEQSMLVSGERHPDALAVRLNLSYDLKATGEIERAKELYEQTVAVMREELGAKHPATVNASRMLRANCDIDMLSL
ncbi:FxSxx-COOH system tetratricopeptide repeat protein [Streptomyces sp. NPDC004111]|uniref:FxSxx-COOH system tetratricopeptide repeat protein n=1 Tax=Streptomyces sp. NPDC004111 TaxID=3364690 RepID=UPI0036755DED